MYTKRKKVTNIELEIQKQKNRQKENKEFTNFTKELEKSLDNKEQEMAKQVDTTIYDEVLNEIELAPKYKRKLKGIIKEGMIEESYEGDFWYINHNKSSDTYTMEFYSEGKCKKNPITLQDIKKYKYKVGMTYFDVEGGILEEDAIKDSIKINVEDALLELEHNNKKKREKQMEKKEYEKEVNNLITEKEANELY